MSPTIAPGSSWCSAAGCRARPTKIARSLGYHPAQDFGEGLAETVEWYRDHPDRWTPLLRNPDAPLKLMDWAEGQALPPQGR
jgi:hypothetical protein